MTLNMEIIAPHAAAMVSALFINSGLLNGTVAGLIGIYFGFVAIILAIRFSKK